MVATKPFLSNKLISVPSKQLVTSVGTNHMALMQGQKHPIQRVMTEFTLLAQIKMYSSGERSVRIDADMQSSWHLI